MLWVVQVWVLQIRSLVRIHLLVDLVEVPSLVWEDLVEVPSLVWEDLVEVLSLVWEEQMVVSESRIS